jgi:hypothetical protein
MKKIITAFALLLTASMGYSQYYQQSYISINRNPLGLNTDVEQTSGVLGPQGWATVQATSASPVWSASQTLPFAFKFNNAAVTNYKVSTTGVLTFDVASTVAAPPEANVAIPSALIPDKSVMAWGMNGNGGNDAIISKTFGTAPHRQHWIMFSSYSAAGGTGWAYWGIMMEETTDRLFVVDMRNYLTPLTLTVGVQVDGTTATSLAASPNVSGVNLNGGSADTPDDNTYYEFGYGTQPAVDVELAGITLPALVANGSNTVLSGSIVNSGSAALTAYDIKYSVNGGTAVSQSFTAQNIPSGTVGSFTLSPAYNAASPGNKDFVFWVEAATDARKYNDTINTTTAVSSGGSGTKRVLLEEFTTAPCQFCPDGEVVVGQILASTPEAIAVGIHAGFGTDAMTIPAHSAYAAAFTTGAPTAAIDRKIFPGETRVGHSRAVWAANVNSQKTNLTPIDINLGGNVTGTNTIDIHVDVQVKDAISNWQDANLTIFVVEDSVIGAGSGYNQVNYYNTQAGHPYTGAGNPIVGYAHRHVVRDVPTGTWGDATFLSSAPVVNTNIARTYSLSLNPAWDKTKMEFVVFMNYYNASTGENAREVINVSHIKYDQLVVGVEENDLAISKLGIHPNPTSGNLNVNFELEQSENVTIEVLDLLGKSVSVQNFGTLVSGAQKLNMDLSDLNSGIYFVKINAGNKVSTQKVNVIK